MDPALAGLAAAAGAALVQAMTRDTWEATKARLGKIFGHHAAARAPDLVRELESSERRLRESPVVLTPVAEEEGRRWAGLLADFLAEHGEAAPEVQELVRDLHLAGRDSFTVVQRITAGRDAYTAGRDQNVPPGADDDER
ncbi:hypothetical protein ABZU32_10330 [Sphaerisporangium sp. NPDC005288]|uniref:hypothetical protein n=1 Tax=Sphaerisporangium sp. NPDC005288 TaxID=3155114 RepID=UPI0033A2ABAE